jgi:hypothetical protein
MKIINLLLILTIAFSCKQNAKQTIKIIKVDPEKSDSVMLSKIASNVDKIILETNEFSLITRIQEIEKTDQYLFINDAGNRVLQFDSSGKFIKQIGRQGRGPGEYISIISIAIDSQNKIVYVASYKQILCFDFSWKLVNVIKQGAMPEFISVVGENLWVVSTSLANKLEDNTYLNITKLIRYTLHGNSVDSMIIKKVFLTGPAGTINPQSYFISDLGSKQYIYYPVLLPEPILRDTIYEIKGNKLIPSIKLDLGDAAKLKNGKKQVYFGNIFQTKNYLFAEYSYHKNRILFCFDYSGNVSYSVCQGFTDDFFRTGIIQLKPLNLETGTMYFTKDAFDLVGNVEGVSENSNPVIFIVNLKGYN